MLSCWQLKNMVKNMFQNVILNVYLEVHSTENQQAVSKKAGLGFTVPIMLKDCFPSGTLLYEVTYISLLKKPLKQNVCIK